MREESRICLGCDIRFPITEFWSHLCGKTYTSPYGGKEFKQCHVCKCWLMTPDKTGYQRHTCSARDEKGAIVDVTHKRWDHSIQAWVLDTDVRSAEKVYDSETNNWVPIDSYKKETKVPDAADIRKDQKAKDAKSEEFIASSCEIPSEFFKDEKKEVYTGKYGGTYTSSMNGSSYTPSSNHYNGYGTGSTYKTSQSVYKPRYIWEGVNGKKWPNTLLRLMTMFHQDDWWKNTKYISDEDWDARLRGEYRPETKSKVVYQTYYEGCDE